MHRAQNNMMWELEGKLLASVSILWHMYDELQDLDYNTIEMKTIFDNNFFFVHQIKICDNFHENRSTPQVLWAFKLLGTRNLYVGKLCINTVHVDNEVQQQ